MPFRRAQTEGNGRSPNTIRVPTLLIMRFLLTGLSSPVSSGGRFPPPPFGAWGGKRGRRAVAFPTTSRAMPAQVGYAHRPRNFIHKGRASDFGSVGNVKTWLFEPTRKNQNENWRSPH